MTQFSMVQFSTRNYENCVCGVQNPMKLSKHVTQANSVVTCNNASDYRTNG